MTSNTLRAFILSQGEELLSGQTVDTNSTWLAEQVSSLGLRVVGGYTAGDVRADIAKAFEIGLDAADVVLCTGGLGPTEDDLTAEALADATGLELHQDPEALDQVRRRYELRGRALPACHDRQALLPVGAVVLENRLGTAPAFMLAVPGRGTLFCMPGVPHEMKGIWADHIRPQLLNLPGVQPPLRWHFNTLGKGESQLQDELRSIPDRFAGVRLGFRARMPGVQVKLEADAGCIDFEEAVCWTRAELGIGCFSDAPGGGPEATLAACIGAMLMERGERLAVAESCTGGLVAHLCITEPGSSQWLDRGSVTYSNEAKVDMLGVQESTLIDEGAVSESVVLEMARGAAEEAGVDWGIATTGIAGPTGGSPEKPVGTVWIACVGPSGERAKKLFLPTGSRTTTRVYSAAIALDFLRRQILRSR